MSDASLNLGIACLSGAYGLVCLGNLVWLISQQKARMKAEAQKDHFFSENQVVVDLTSLMKADPAAVQKALLDDRFKTPVSEKIMAALMHSEETEWQQQYLDRKSRKASYDDLQVIERALKENKIPYKVRLRKNPVRAKDRNFILGRPHQDLIRHRMVVARRQEHYMTL